MSLSTGKERRGILVMNCCGGMGNRVLAYLSGILAAQKRGYEFRYAWEIFPARHGRHDKDVFPLELGELWQVKEPPVSKTYMAKLVDRGAIRIGLRQSHKLAGVLPTIEEGRDIVIDGHGHLLGYGELMDCARDHLWPLSRTVEEVNAWARDHFEGHEVAAIQLRAGGRHTGGEKTVKRFLPLCRELVADGQKLFLSCEVPRVVTQFKEEFGDALCCMPRPNRVNTPDAMRMCVSELYAMCAVPFLYRTKASGYGHFAAILRGKDRHVEEV
jgi:hypothetical protein